MNLPLQQIIDDDLRLQQEDRKERGNYWYASEIGYCPRKAFFSRLKMKPDKEKDARTLRVFEVGRRLESFLLDGIVSKQNKTIGDLTIIGAEREVECNNDKLNVHGRIDLIVRYADGDEIIEAKSQSSRSFTYMVEKGEGANESHICQLWFYLHTKQVEHGQICYLSKDDLRIVQYPINLSDKKTGKMVLGKIDFLNQNWEDKKLPSAEDTWLCKYCDYAESCKKIKKFKGIKSIKK